MHAVSQAIADAIAAEAPMLKDRTRVIPNPVEVSVFTPPARERLTGDTPRVVFTGRIHPEKGLHVLVRAIGLLKARHAGLQLRLIGASRIDQGGAGPEYVTELNKLATDLGVPLTISEPIFERPALAAALQEADIYCYPSLAEKGEASPIAPVEAMATGLAPVVSDIPQFRDYITPGQTGLAFDHRGTVEQAAANLAGAISELLNDPARARLMGQAAYARAQQLSYEHIADAFLADFRSLVG
jgi:glycosyltransferase involved in cell wall biosynthesis